MSTTNGKINLFLGTNAFQKNCKKLCEISTQTIKDRKEIVVEVGLPKSGECFALIARMSYYYS